MINRPKPPPHIQKRIKEEEAKKKAQREKRSQNKTSNNDIRSMTGSHFGKDLQTESNKEAFNTQYPLKPFLNKIKEENEDMGKYLNPK